MSGKRKAYRTLQSTKQIYAYEGVLSIIPVMAIPESAILRSDLRIDTNDLIKLGIKDAESREVLASIVLDRSPITIDRKFHFISNKKIKVFAIELLEDDAWLDDTYKIKSNLKTNRHGGVARFSLFGRKHDHKRCKDQVGGRVINQIELIAKVSKKADQLLQDCIVFQIEIKMKEISS